MTLVSPSVLLPDSGGSDRRTDGFSHAVCGTFCLTLVCRPPLCGPDRHSVLPAPTETPGSTENVENIEKYAIQLCQNSINFKKVFRTNMVIFTLQYHMPRYDSRKHYAAGKRRTSASWRSLKKIWCIWKVKYGSYNYMWKLSLNVFLISRCYCIIKLGAIWKCSIERRT